MAEDFRDRARKRAAERATSIWFKLKEAENTIRILPTPASKSTPDRFIEYAVHREVGPKKQMVRCGKDPVNHYEGDCWLCDVTIPKLRAKGNDVRADALEARDVCAMQIASVIETDNGVEYRGPFIFTPATTLADTILASIFGSRKRDYTDPEKGYNITINRTGTGRNDTRYSAPMPDEEPSKIPKKFIGLVDKLKPFSELKEIPAYSEAKQKAAYIGKDVVDDDPEEEDESAPKRRRDVEEDEGDEAEEAPPPRKRRVPAEDEDEPTPVKRRTEPIEEEGEADEETQARPRKRAVVEDDEADPPPKKKRPPVEEDEPEPRPKKRNYAETIDEDSQQEADEDNEPDPDDPDEADEPPPRKGKAAPVPITKKRK
jgi:gp32 DNA binding protein like